MALWLFFFFGHALPLIPRRVSKSSFWLPETSVSLWAQNLPSPVICEAHEKGKGRLPLLSQLWLLGLGSRASPHSVWPSG